MWVPPTANATTGNDSGRSDGSSGTRLLGEIGTRSNMPQTRFLSGLLLRVVACMLASHPQLWAAEHDDRSRPALLEAVRAADKDRVQRLLRQGADVNARTDDGTTAVMHATAVGDIELVKM